MAVTENDLETLEVWLDGELSEEQAEALRRRVSVEPELSQTLDRLRSDRQLRAGIFQAMEPSGAEIETLVANVRGGVRKEELINSRLRGFRNIAAVAASVAIVFMAGWISRTRLTVGPKNEVVATAPNVQLPVIIGNTAGSAAGTIQMPRPQGTRSGANGIVTVSGSEVPRSAPAPRPTGNLTLSSGAPNRPLYNVRVINPFGRVVFEGFIDKLDDIKELPEVVMDNERAILPSTGNQPVPVNHESPLPR